MKTTLIFCVSALCLCAISNSNAQPARPKERTSPVAAHPVSVNPRNIIYETNTVTITDSKGAVITTSNVVTATVIQDPPTRPVGLEKTEATLSIINNHVSLNSGVVLLNPYRLTTNGITGDPTNRRRLEKSEGTDAKFFVELVINYVWAWDTERRAGIARYMKGQDGAVAIWTPCLDWQDRWATDVQGRISYYAKDSKETTTSAIIGSGSFGSEITLGLPILRAIHTADGTVPRPNGRLTQEQRDQLYDNTRSVHWAGAVFSYSAVTDSDAFDVHSRFLIGVGYRGAFKTPFTVASGTRLREVVVNFTLGCAFVDTVEFLNNNSREIRVHHEDVPRYRVHGAFAMEMEAYYPLTSSLNAVMGSRIYSGLDPSTWNAYFGLTIPMDKISDFLK